MSGAAGARVALVIPALNEERALPWVFEDLPRELVEVVVVVDNGSTDRTAEIARGLGARVVHEPRRGYGQACLRGLAYVFGEHRGAEGHLQPPLADGDIVVFLDADYSDHPEELPELLAPLHEQRADMVIGSRILGGADRAAMLPQAWFGNRFACWLMRLLFGARYTDLGPFRAIRAGALRHLQMVDRDFGWTIEMQLKAHAAGMRVVEVPARYRARIGQSKITGTVRGTLSAGIKILGWILAWRLALLLPRRRIPTYLSPQRSGTR